MADRTHSHDTSTPAMSDETVPSEEAAKLVYEAMVWARDQQPGVPVPKWIDGGNSDAQYEARRVIRKIADLSASHLAKEGGEAGAVEPIEKHRIANRLRGMFDMSMSSADDFNRLTPAGFRLLRQAHDALIAPDEAVAASAPNPSPAAKGGDAVRDRLPAGHVVLEQADIVDGTGRVAQTVSIGPEGAPGSVEYQRIVHADEAYGDVE